MAVKNSRRFEFKLGKIGIIVLIFGVALLIFFSFIFGVAVGKHIEAYPEKIAGGIPQLIKEHLDFFSGKGENITHNKQDDTIEEAKQDFNLTFYDTLAGKKGRANEVISDYNKDKRTSTEGLRQQSLSDLKNTDNNQSALQIKNQDVLSTMPSTASKEEKKKSTNPEDAAPKESKNAAKGKYTIQVVSYRERTKADALSSTLAAMGYAPRIVAANLSSKGKWYRVVLRDFESRQEAQNISDKLMKSVKGVHCVIITD